MASMLWHALVISFSDDIDSHFVNNHMQLHVVQYHGSCAAFEGCSDYRQPFG
jgi:hypothetical protein